jgi:signal recognition particle subunit SRP54
MFDSLQSGLQTAFKSLRGKGKLTEANMRTGLGLVEQSLLEADVSYEVVQSFMGHVTEAALGEKVLLALNPDEQLIGIVNQELINILGPVDNSLPADKDVNIYMMCGLQGSGKTTTCGKLATLLKQQGVTPLLCAADLQRPAAIDQLHVIGDSLGVPVYSDRENKDPVKVCQAAVQKARQDGNKVVILDTAGRLAIDKELMQQLQSIDRKVQPHQVFLVVDGMTGQDAVNSAAAFNEALELNGVIMTKLDGDARGGALLSVKQVTGVPIKFIGTGEQLDALEPFRPEGMASRILGMGDIVAAVEEAQKIVSQEEQEKLEQQLAKGDFTLDDFRNQMQKFANPGLMMKMMSLIPGMGQMKEMMGNDDHTNEIRRMVGIIDSMTSHERKNPKLIDAGRRQRIATGAGVATQQVNELIKQFETMKPMLTGMAGKGAGERMQMFEKMKEQALSNPGGRGPREKKGTGARLSSTDKKKARKNREKELRKRLRDKKKNK